MQEKQKEYIQLRIRLVFSEYREFIYTKVGKEFAAEYSTGYDREKKLLQERFNDPDYIFTDYEPAYQKRAIYDAIRFALTEIDKMKYASYLIRTRGEKVRKWYAVALGELNADMAFLKERLAEMKKAR